MGRRWAYSLKRQEQTEREVFEKKHRSVESVVALSSVIQFI